MRVCGDREAGYVFENVFRYRALVALELRRGEGRRHLAFDDERPSLVVEDHGVRRSTFFIFTAVIIIRARQALLDDVQRTHRRMTPRPKGLEEAVEQCTIVMEHAGEAVGQLVLRLAVLIEDVSHSQFGLGTVRPGPSPNTAIKEPLIVETRSGDCVSTKAGPGSDSMFVRIIRRRR